MVLLPNNNLTTTLKDNKIFLIYLYWFIKAYKMLEKKYKDKN